jgi:glycosyltransferase involved in cell wall biosynthesis
MKILCMAPLSFGELSGRQIHLRHTLRTLSEMGHQVDLLYFGTGKAPEYPGVRPIPVTRLIVLPGSNGSFPGLIWMALRAAFLLLRRPYEFVHAMDRACLAAWPVRRLIRGPLLCDVGLLRSEELADSGRWFDRLRAAATRRMERKVLSAASLVIADCVSLCEAVRARAPSARLMLVEDAPLEAMAPDRRERADAMRREWPLGDRKCIVYAGRLDRDGGVELLLRAMHHVIRQEPDAALILVGGRDREIRHMRGLAHHLALDQHCHFFGQRPFDEMLDCIELASAVVAPRLRGSRASMKIYVYMQSGRPIVATRIPAHTQVLDAECAILTPVQVDDLAAGLLRALREPLLGCAMGREAQDRAARNYNAAAFRSRMRAAYQRAVGEAAAAG